MISPEDFMSPLHSIHVAMVEKHCTTLLRDASRILFYVNFIPRPGQTQLLPYSKSFRTGRVDQKTS